MGGDKEMIRDITIGQYYMADSTIHRLDPRTKLLGTVLYIIALFLAEGILGYMLSFLFLATVIHLSKVPVKYMTKGLKSLFLLLLFSVSFTIFLTDGKPIFHIGKLQATWEGVVVAIRTVIRLVMLLMSSTIMTLTTTPNDLTDGLEKGLGFLKKIHVPIHEIAMMMSIALRFIPVLIEETDKIMKAQMARGADFESGNLIQRVKNMIPLLVPLFISAWRRSFDLAMAMEARCYRGGEHRTKMKPLVYQKIDYVAYFVLFAFMASILFLKVV